MPITWQPYFCTAHLTTARITAFSPGQSPPPVQMPMVRTSLMPAHSRENRF
jgi:hypothetical protein